VATIGKQQQQPVLGKVATIWQSQSITSTGNKSNDDRQVSTKVTEVVTAIAK